MSKQPKTTHLDAAEGEARRFLEKVSLLRVRITVAAYGEGQYLDIPGRENAAMKRASLDLSRALADLRRKGV